MNYPPWIVLQEYDCMERQGLKFSEIDVFESGIVLKLSDVNISFNTLCSLGLDYSICMIIL